MTTLADPDYRPPAIADATAAVAARDSAPDHATVIERQKGWRTLDLAELWSYRELLFVLTMRDISVRYKQTVLGFAWAIIQPVMHSA
jgi:lipopolysaccharide transport system permease protein